MNKTELTAAIYCAYWGSRVAIYSNTAPKKRIVAEIMTVGTNGMYDIATVHLEDKSTFPVALSDCKLLLNPLSLITDEDAIEIARLIICDHLHYPASHYAIVRDDTKSSISIRLQNDWFDETVRIGNGGTVWMPFRQNSRIGINVYDYLRSKSYDCDGLLQSGIAEPIE